MVCTMGHGRVSPEGERQDFSGPSCPALLPVTT